MDPRCPPWAVALTAFAVTVVPPASEITEKVMDSCAVVATGGTICGLQAPPRVHQPECDRSPAVQQLQLAVAQGRVAWMSGSPAAFFYGNPTGSRTATA
jgi:hypothetical protein